MQILVATITKRKHWDQVTSFVKIEKILTRKKRGGST